MATRTIGPLVRRPAARAAARFPGRFLSVTSFKRDGAGVATPVWFVSEGHSVSEDRPAASAASEDTDRSAASAASRLDGVRKVLTAVDPDSGSRQRIRALA